MSRLRDTVQLQPTEVNKRESNSRQVSVSQICTKPCVTLSTCLSNTNVQRLNFQATFRVTKTKRASGAFSHCEELTVAAREILEVYFFCCSDGAHCPQTVTVSFLFPQLDRSLWEVFIILRVLFAGTCGSLVAAPRSWCSAAFLCCLVLLRSQNIS